MIILIEVQICQKLVPFNSMRAFLLTKSIEQEKLFVENSVFAGINTR